MHQRFYSSFCLKLTLNLLLVGRTRQVTQYTVSGMQWVQGSSPWRCTKDFVSCCFFFVCDFALSSTKATDSEFATCRSDTTSHAIYRKRYAVGEGCTKDFMFFIFCSKHKPMCTKSACRQISTFACFLDLNFVLF